MSLINIYNTGVTKKFCFSLTINFSLQSQILFILPVKVDIFLCFKILKQELLNMKAIIKGQIHIMIIMMIPCQNVN